MSEGQTSPIYRSPLTKFISLLCGWLFYIKCYAGGCFTLHVAISALKDVLSFNPTISVSPSPFTSYYITVLPMSTQVPPTAIITNGGDKPNDEPDITSAFTVISGSGAKTSWLNLYRPQRSCGKVMFSEASVILFTGGCLPSACWDTSPLGSTPRYASYYNVFLFN